MPRKIPVVSEDVTPASTPVEKPAEEGLEMRFVPVLGYSILAKDAADAEERAKKILADQPTPLTDGQ